MVIAGMDLERLRLIDPPKSRLQDHLHRRKLQGKKEVSQLEGRETGTVKWFNESKGYGFIERDQGGDVFVHYTGIVGQGFRTLQEGQRVEFLIVEADKGPQAKDVSVLY